jgi:hypothetical protein
MRAKSVNEYQVFKPKTKESIISDFINIDNAMPLVNQIGAILEQIPPGSFTYEEMRDIVNQLTQMAADYYNDVHLEDLMDNELTESLIDTFKPKSKEDIIKQMRDLYSSTEVTLKDGRLAWYFEDSFKDMGGEYVEFLSLVDENGDKQFITNDNLNLFEIPDRKDIVRQLNLINRL